MLHKGWIDRRRLASLVSLPAWLPYLLLFHTLTLLLRTSGDDTPEAISRVWMRGVAMSLNLVFVAAGCVSLLKHALHVWATWNEAKKFIDRVWSIATHGVGSVETVGDDLGEPDRRGIYTRTTRTGRMLYLRMAKGSMSGDADVKVWQWSLDKRLWTSTAKVRPSSLLPSEAVAQVDRYWDDAREAADKILLRRLEVETAFREKQPCLPASFQPPAIDLRLDGKERRRLSETVPRSFLCPISMEIMTEPVVTPAGITYDRGSLVEWLNTHHTDPATQAPLKLDHLYPNLSLRDMIQEWLVEHRFLGSKA